jgi:Fe-S-cluster containining protein
MKDISEMEGILTNYRNLLARIDALCRGIREALDDQIVCAEGCSSCCTAITLFPVEAAGLAEALKELPEQTAEEIRRHVAEHAGGERCPLLRRHRCLLYGARPVICRTHGFPILYTEGEERRLDCCPLNMTEQESLSGSAIIDLDRLNTLLVAINALFVSKSGASGLPERVTIAEAILGDVFTQDRRSDNDATPGE